MMEQGWPRSIPNINWPDAIEVAREKPEVRLCLLAVTGHRAYYRDCVGAATFDTWATQHPEELARVMDK
jgi:hypothetical protein